MSELGFDIQAEDTTAVDGTPILAIAHDDLPAPYAPYASFAGKKVIVLRSMAVRSAWAMGGGVPVGVIWQFANEFDNPNDPWWGPTGWARTLIPQFKAANPGRPVAYPGPPVSNYVQGDTEVLALCDVFILHIGVNADGSYFPTPADMQAAGWPLEGKQIIIGEAEVDPAHPEALAQLVPATAKACADYGATYGFLWGMSMDESNAVQNVDGIDFRGQVAAYNASQGGTAVATPTTQPAGTLEQMQAQIADMESRLASVEKRESLTVDAMAKEIANRILGFPASNLEGPGSAAADVDAEAGGTPVVETQVSEETPANPQ